MNRVKLALRTAKRRGTVAAPTRVRAKVQWLTRDELRRVLIAARETEEWHWLLILTTYWHGLRASEATSMQGIHIRDGHVSIGRLKGSNAAIHPFVHDDDPVFDEAPALRHLAANVTDDEFLFPVGRFAFNKIMERYGKRAGIPKHKQHPHALKHSITMHLINGGMSFPEVRVYMGWKSLASAGVYMVPTTEHVCRGVAAAAKGGQ